MLAAAERAVEYARDMTDVADLVGDRRSFC